MADRAQPLKYGAVAAAAILVGGAGVAGAGALIDSSDVKNGSLKLTDLTRATREKIINRGLVVTTGFSSTGIVQDYVVGGTNQTAFNTITSTLTPPGLSTVRGLAVNAFVSKTNTKISGLEVTLLKNGNPTGLSCTTGADGTCNDNGTVKTPVETGLIARYDATTSNNSGTAVVSLAVE